MSVSTVFEFNFLMVFRISNDFNTNDTLDLKCEVPQSSELSKIFTIELKDFHRVYCYKRFGIMYVHSKDELHWNGLLFMLFAHLTTIRLQPKIVTTDESLRIVSPSKRHCFFADENHLRFFAKYSKENCKLECKSNITSRVCGCVNYYIIRKDNFIIVKIQILISFSLSGDNMTNICTNADRQCYEDIDSTVNDEGSEEYKSCNCLSSCNSVEYKTTIIQTRLTTLNDSHGLRYASTSILFEDEEFFAYKRYASFGTVAFLSNIGGLLGLFLGISVLSIVEFFYFFTIRLIHNLWLKIS